MLVKSLKNNDALHTVLLGGNPGFTVELAQSISRITSKSPLRLRYMPKGVAILLERWIKLQLTERTGGIILQDISVTVIDRRFLGTTQNHGNNSQDEIDILDIHRSHTGDVIDFRNIDHGVKDIFMIEEHSAKIGEPSLATAVGIGKELGVKPDTVIDKNVKTQHSIEWGAIRASDTELPENNFLSERSWYEEGSDVLNRCSEEQEPYLENILHLEDESSLPHDDSIKGSTGAPVEYGLSSIGIALNNQEKETKRNRSNLPSSVAASAHVSEHAPKQEGDKIVRSTVSACATSDKPYKRNSPVFFREDVEEKDNKGLRYGDNVEAEGWIGVGDGAVSGVGGRVEGWRGTGDRSKEHFLTSKVHNYFNKAIRSSSTERKYIHRKEVESPSPRHPADSGNFNFNISRNSRGGYSRDKGTTGAIGSPVNRLGQTPQSVTPQSVLHSSDKGQGQGRGVEQKRGQGRGRRHGHGQGQGEYKKLSSPIFLIRSIHSHSESTIRYPLHRNQHIDDAHDSSDHGSSPNYRHTEEDKMMSSASRKNKKNSKNSSTKKSKKRNQDLIIPPSSLSETHHTALEHAMSCFSESVKEVTESLGSVCAQLRDVTSSLSESLSELNKSHIRSPLSSALPTHNTHNSPSIIPGLGPVLIPIPIAVAGFGNKLAGVLDFDAKKSNNLIPLGETFGRSRGSLMHRDNEVKNEFKRDESNRNDTSHRGYYEGVPDVGTVKRSTLQKVHALLEERESTDRGSNTSSTLINSGNPQKTLSRTKSSRSSTFTTTERDREKGKDGNEDDMKNDLSIDNESEIEIIRDSIRNTESVASHNQNQNRVHSPLRDSSTSEDTSFNYSKFSRPKLGPKSKDPSQNSDFMLGGGHITQADMVAFIKERLHRKLHAVLRPL